MRTISNKLTPKQTQVYLAIKGFTNKYGYSPSIREICTMCEIKNPSVVLSHLKKAKKKGYITYEERKMRTVKILKELDYDEI